MTSHQPSLPKRRACHHSWLSANVLAPKGFEYGYSNLDKNSLNTCSAYTPANQAEELSARY